MSAAALFCQVCEAPAVAVIAGGAGGDTPHCAAHRPCDCGAYLLTDGAPTVEDGELHAADACEGEPAACGHCGGSLFSGEPACASCREGGAL